MVGQSAKVMTQEEVVAEIDAPLMNERVRAPNGR